MASLVNLIRRGWNQPPRVILTWIARKLRARRAARQLPLWNRWYSPDMVARAVKRADARDLVGIMRKTNPFPGLVRPAGYRSMLSEESKKEIALRAARARNRQVDFLGSGLTQLSEPVDWCLDFKSGTRWSMDPSLKLPINDLGNPSDIKVPWELSRLQWLLPVGQQYVLMGDEKDAAFARKIIEEWMIANPVCRGPNWICAMDVALRAISMLWLFHACKTSKAWNDQTFQAVFAKSLFLHGRFIETNLEFADVNGNHLTADLAGLTLIGVSLGGDGVAERWIDRAWSLLCKELAEQVEPDGVCREASAPYHRLVAELFLLPTLARRETEYPVDNDFLERLKSMATFTASITGPDGQVPNWGDGDDGRALALGTQGLNDHRYLVELLGCLDGTVRTPEHDETLWWCGVGNRKSKGNPPPFEDAFSDAGVFILRHANNHVVVDAGPVGMAGRGGHGHNDCLSLEASLRGERLIIDPGTYTYTADVEARNWFRGTAAHNSPMIDNMEINQVPDPAWLWVLSDDAKPEVRHRKSSDGAEVLIASHSGYQRLPSPVRPIRSIILDKTTEGLLIRDAFEGSGQHGVKITFTLAPDVRIHALDTNLWRLSKNGHVFTIVGEFPDSGEIVVQDAKVSPSYGVLVDTKCVTITTSGSLAPIMVGLLAGEHDHTAMLNWLSSLIHSDLPGQNAE